MHDDAVILALNTVCWKRNTRGARWGKDYVTAFAGHEEPLYKDELMDLFEPHGDDPLLPIIQLPLSIRHRFFNREISKQVKRKDDLAVKQVIILGSGLDIRRVRKKKYTQDYDVSFFECDRASVLQHKRDVLHKHGIEPNSKMMSVDYIKEDLIAALEKQDCDFTKPTFILLEGNTMYIDKASLQLLFAKLKAKFKHLVIAFDYMHEDFILQKQQEAEAEIAKGNFAVLPVSLS